MAGTVKTTFLNSDLDINFEYIWVHGKGTTNVSPTWFDETGENRSGPNTFTVIDQNTLKINTGGAVTGTQEIVMFYDDAVSVSGRRLFELPDASTIDDTYRFAIGKAGSPSLNIPYGSLVTTLVDSIGTDVFQIPNLFSELTPLTIPQRVTARQNLGNGSSDAVQTKNDVAATLNGYVTTNNALAQANANSISTLYVPTSSTNLTTKAYVDAQKATYTTPTINFGGINGNITNYTQLSAYEYIFGTTNGNSIHQFNVSFRFRSVLASPTDENYIGFIPGLNVGATRYFSINASLPTTQESCRIEIRAAVGGQAVGNGYIYAYPGTGLPASPLAYWIFNEMITYVI